MKTTIESGELSGAVNKWQVSIEVGAHGNYIYTQSKENTQDLTYERNFEVIFALYIRQRVLLSHRLRPSCKAGDTPDDFTRRSPRSAYKIADIWHVRYR